MSAPATAVEARAANFTAGAVRIPRTIPGVLPALDAREEQAALREIRELEIGRWRAVLGHRDSVERVTRPLLRDLRSRERDDSEVARARRTLRMLERSADRAGSAGATDRRYRARLERTARAAYEADPDRIHIEAAHRRSVRSFQRSAAPTVSQLETVRAAARKSETARHRFIQANLALVISIARRFWRCQLPFEDLLQEGTLGLIKALNKFDVDREVRFSTYAAWWIRHLISHAIESQSRVVRLPTHLNVALRKVRCAERQLAASLGHAPDDQEILREAGIPKSKLELIRRRAVRGTASIDADPNDESTNYSIPQLRDDSGPSPYDETLSRTFTRKIDDLLETLSPMERAVVDARFGLSDRTEGATFREIGEAFDLSRERIRQIQNIALGKLRDQLEQPNN